MKNPWMSAWLSAANRMNSAARGQVMAEISKAQTAAMQDLQRLWFEAWLAMWFPGAQRQQDTPRNSRSGKAGLGKAGTGHARR